MSFYAPISSSLLLYESATLPLTPREEHAAPVCNKLHVCQSGSLKCQGSRLGHVTFEYDGFFFHPIIHIQPVSEKERASENRERV